MQKIGLEAVFITAAFTKGLQTYVKGVKQAKDATLDTASQINTAGTLMGGGMGTALQGAAAAFGVVGTAAAVAAAAVVGAMVAATAAVIGFAGAMLKLGIAAKDVEGVEFAFNRMAGTVGLDIQKLRTAAGGLISDFDLMKRSNLALSGAGEELAKRFGQDLPQILEIARAGAKATGQSFDYIFNSLVTGIKRASPRLIDNIGLQIKLGDENKRLADQLGKTVDQLTAEEKQIAVLNAVMANGTSFTSTFAGANETLGEKMSRSKANLQNIASVLGQYFIPALKTAFDTINRLLEAFSKSIQEGGKLYNVMVLLGAVFQLVADGFAKGVDALMEWVSSTTDGIEGSFTDLITKAMQWGFDLVGEFALGMIRAATTVLQSALNFLSGSLLGWFVVHSAPKIAPGIDKWGAATMTEFLKGFASADFDILKSVQGPLKSILDVFASSGAISKVNSKQLFADISKSMIGGLASGDLSSVYDQIVNAAGTYGIELVKLIKLNVQYAAGQKKVAAAEKAVLDARKKEEKLNTDLSLQMMEYNDLARAGASPAVLAAKLAGINATEDQLLAAQGETKAAEESKTTAEEQLDVIKEQMQLQKDLVDTLIDLAKAQDEVTQAQKEAAKAAAGGGGAGGGLGLNEEDFGMAWEGLGETLGEKLGIAIDVARIIMIAKFKELWNDLYFNHLKPEWDNLTGKWNEFTAIMGGIWGTFWGGVTETWNTWNTDFTTGWTTFWGGVSTTWNTWITDITTGWATFWGGVTTTWETWKTNFTTGWDTFWGGVAATWETWKTNFTTAFNDLKDHVLAPFKEAWDGISEAIQNVIKWIGTVATKLSNVKPPWWAIGKSPSPLEIGFTGIGEAMSDLANIRVPELQRALSLSPAMASQPISTSYNNTSNVHMGGVSIYNGMGVGELESAIRRVMRSEMAGA